ncbi:MAG: hypothetical protein AB7U29_07385 [Desulfobulbus sp.]
MSNYSEQELCRRITALYPDIGECGKNINVSYNETKKAWLVHLEKDTHSLDHFLESPDADPCMDGKQCVALGLEIAQLKNNLEGKQF